ncbi:MAG: hypothetical protein ACKPBT_09140 [Microcystis aeruginosa]
MTNPPLGISLLVGSQALSYIRQWRSAFGIALQLLQQHIVLCMGTNPEPNHRIIL